MKSKLVVIICFFMASCSTMKKSIIYPAIAGAVIGGIIGKELSPNKESNAFNAGLGGVAGATVGAGIGYMFYKEANPDLDLKDSPIREQEIEPIRENGYVNDKFVILPTLVPVGDKQYINLPTDIPQEVQDTTKKQYYRKYQVQNYTFEKDGKNYKVPDFEIIETGVE